LSKVFKQALRETFGIEKIPSKATFGRILNMVQEMLTYLDVESKVVTADAMHCQRETSRRIVQKKGDYLFGLKENQPSLLGLV